MSQIFADLFMLTRAATTVPAGKLLATALVRAFSALITTAT